MPKEILVIPTRESYPQSGFYNLDASYGTKYVRAEKSAPVGDDEAVSKFASAMKDKLAQKRNEGRGGWETMTSEQLSSMLVGHVLKGDPVDVANFCMMLWNNGQFISQPKQPAPMPKIEGLAEVFAKEGYDPIHIKNKFGKYPNQIVEEAARAYLALQGGD